jgi:hypothetical protein
MEYTRVPKRVRKFDQSPIKRKLCEIEWISENPHSFQVIYFWFILTFKGTFFINKNNMLQRAGSKIFLFFFFFLSSLLLRWIQLINVCRSNKWAVKLTGISNRFQRKKMMILMRWKMLWFDSINFDCVLICDEILNLFLSFLLLFELCISWKMSGIFPENYHSKFWQFEKDNFDSLKWEILTV